MARWQKCRPPRPSNIRNDMYLASEAIKRLGKEKGVTFLSQASSKTLTDL
jgi:hypothetical protein